VLSITDAFTKYTVVTAISNKEAETVADTICKEWFCKFGIPAQIHKEERTLSTNCQPNIFKFSMSSTPEHHQHTHRATLWWKFSIKQSKSFNLHMNWPVTMAQQQKSTLTTALNLIHSKLVTKDFVTLQNPKLAAK
jgi:hypothetical protein